MLNATELQPATRGAIGAGPIVLEAIPNPFSNEIITIRGPEGATIAELLETAGIHWRRYGGGACWIEDAGRRAEPVVIPRGVWHRVRPKAGTTTTVKLMPGRGGGGGKQILTIVLAIAVTALAAWAGPELAALIPGLTSTQAAAVGAAISVGIPVMGALTLSACKPPAARPLIASRDRA